MAEYIDRERLLHRFNIDDMMNVNGTLVSLNDARNIISGFPAADVAPVGWISVKDKLPEPETEVLAVCVRNGYRFICPVIFEDGTMLTQNSMWNWYELENYGTPSGFRTMSSGGDTAGNGCGPDGGRRVGAVRH